MNVQNPNLDQIKDLISNLLLTQLILESKNEFYQEIKERVNKYLKLHSFDLEKGKLVNKRYIYRKLRYRLYFFLFQDKKRILTESVIVFEEEFMRRT